MTTRTPEQLAAIEANVDAHGKMPTVLALMDRAETAERLLARARRWIETCVDPVTVGPLVKKAMLDYLDGKRDLPNDFANATDTTGGMG